jgi:hypothetical protein
MKKIISIFLIGLTLSTSGFCGQGLLSDDPPKISVTVLEELNRPLISAETPKLKVGDWIWIGAFVAVAIASGAIAYNTRTKLSF